MPVQHVGRPVKRVEDPKLVTGRDPYVNDVRVPNALAMAMVRSPYAHATIRALDTHTARAVPGVVAGLPSPDLDAAARTTPTPLPDPEHGTNLCVALRREKGDVDGASRDAAIVVELDMMNQRLVPLAMEPR